MTITFTRGDIFASPPGTALVNPVNCVGVSGAGMAKEVARRFPISAARYRSVALEGGMRGGGLLFCPGQSGERDIFHLATKRHWRNKSRIDDVAAGLSLLADTINSKPYISAIAVPALGCGLGGLDWADVRPLIVAALGPLEEINVTVYEPGGAP